MIAQPLFQKAKSKNSWNRPGDWRPLPAPSSEGFSGLHAVWENDSNFVAFTVAGAYTVDWGDGAVENLASGATANHIYSWADLPASSLTSRGYRQAIIRITPQSGANLTSINLHVKHSQAGLVSAYSSGWLELKYNTPSLTGFLNIAQAATLVRHRHLERVQFLALGSISAYQAFNVCSGLIQVDFPANTPVSANGALFCELAVSLKSAPFINTSSMTAFGRSFNGCTSLTSIPLYDLSACTDMQTAFSGCVALKEIPALNLSAVTNFTNTFFNCQSLSRVRATGINATVSFANCSLSAAALNEIYTNLSATGSGKTITVTGNFGTSSDDPSIATAKGWTVTG